MVIDDEEFYVQQMPFKLNELVDLTIMLKQYMVSKFWNPNVRRSNQVAFHNDKPSCAYLLLLLFATINLHVHSNHII